MKIEWNGGECPVAPDTLVKVWFRGEKEAYENIRKAHWWMWDCYGEYDDIIAYEVVEQTAPTRTWQATVSHQYVRRPIFSDSPPQATVILVHQQLWQCIETGETEWRDVPTVNEGE